MYCDYTTFVTDTGFVNVFGCCDMRYKIKSKGIIHKVYTLFVYSNVDKRRYELCISPNRGALEQIKDFCIQAQLKGADIIDIRRKCNRR